jgi:hypothetical protein
MLKSEHGALHDPCPHSPFENGLYTPWSPAQVNFVDPPFNHAKHWLLKAADEAQQHKHSLVLMPFRPHTRYMWEALQHAASVCMLSKPIQFETPDDKQFGRPLPTPVCLVSFGANLAPSARHSVTPASFARLRSCDASLHNIKQMVLQCTGSACEIVGSPISGGTLRVAATEYCSATLCTVTMTKKAIQKPFLAAHHVTFLSPPLARYNGCIHEHRCVEGSFVAFFCEPEDFRYKAHAFKMNLSILDPPECSAMKRK